MAPCGTLRFHYCWTCRATPYQRSNAPCPPPAWWRCSVAAAHWQGHQESYCVLAPRPNSGDRWYQLLAAHAVCCRSGCNCVEPVRFALVARTGQGAHPARGDPSVADEAGPASRVPDGAVAAEPYCPGVPASSLPQLKPRGCFHDWGQRLAAGNRTTPHGHCDRAGRFDHYGPSARGDQIVPQSDASLAGDQSILCAGRLENAPCAGAGAQIVIAAHEPRAAQSARQRGANRYDACRSMPVGESACRDRVPTAATWTHRHPREG
jgi:hypothetical protein